MRHLALRLAILVGLSGAVACAENHGPDGPGLVLRGVVLDSAGLPVPQAHIRLIRVPGYNDWAALSNDAGAYELRIDSLPSAVDTFLLAMSSPRCFGPGTIDTLTPEQVRMLTTRDFVSPVPAPRPILTSPRLCAEDHWPGWVDGTMFVYLTIDSTQTVTDGDVTVFGGEWIHETAISTVGWVGEYRGTLEPTRVSLHLTYSDSSGFQTPVPTCRVQLLSAGRLPDGRWAPFRSTTPACPIGQKPLAFDVAP